ncbi:hypothetical protein F0325_21500, partial [Enterobacter ludwigii]|uniref:hypothetical protein n=1 Tax=Enterobacter ludwigii TaxID=299767 RepID=UPI0011EF608E
MSGEALLRRVMPHIRLMGESACRARLMDASELFPDLLQQALEREYVAWGEGDRDGVALSSRVDLRLAHEEEYGDWWLVGRRPAGAVLKSVHIDRVEISVAGRGVIAIEHPDPFALLGRGLVGTASDSITVRAPGRGAKWMRVDR